MTTHDLARALLEMRDVPVVVRARDGDFLEVEMADVQMQMVVSDGKKWDWRQYRTMNGVVLTGQEMTVLVIWRCW